MDTQQQRSTAATLRAVSQFRVVARFIAGSLSLSLSRLLVFSTNSIMCSIVVTALALFFFLIILFLAVCASCLL